MNCDYHRELLIISLRNTISLYPIKVSNIRPFSAYARQLKIRNEECIIIFKLHHGYNSPWRQQRVKEPSPQLFLGAIRWLFLSRRPAVTLTRQLRREILQIRSSTPTRRGSRPTDRWQRGGGVAWTRGLWRVASRRARNLSRPRIITPLCLPSYILVLYPWPSLYEDHASQPSTFARDSVSLFPRRFSFLLKRNLPLL